MMRIATLFLMAFVLAIAPPAYAAPGFVEESIWFSKEPVFAGEIVRIFTVVANPSKTPLEGVVTFFDAEREIGRRDVSLGAGASELISVDWTAGEGGHEFYAAFEGGGGNGTPAAQTRTAKLARHIVPDTDGDGIGNDADTDDDNDGIPDDEDENPLVHTREKLVSDAKEGAGKVVDTVKPFVEEQGPKVVAVAKAIAETVEDFRESQGEALSEKRDQLRAESTTFEGGEADGPSVGSRLLLAAVGAAAFTFNHALLFYLVLLFGLYLGARKGIALIRARTGADRLDDE